MTVAQWVGVRTEAPVLPNLQFGKREYQHLQCETKTVSWHQKDAINRVSTSMVGLRNMDVYNKCLRL